MKGPCQRCNWDRGRYIPREFAPNRTFSGAAGSAPFHEDLLKFITPAYAQAAARGDTSSMVMSLLPFALIFVIMYFLILRPQQK